MNIDRSHRVLQQLKNFGVEEVALCPGGRNATFVELLDHCQSFSISGFYDERSAGFWALGRIQARAKPVAVVTTSGTAVAELLPSVIEAHYQGLPLICVTADRPRVFRGTGAPQTIEQADLLKPYAKNSYDYCETQGRPGPLSLEGPSHINICFDEPVLDVPLPLEGYDIQSPEKAPESPKAFAPRSLSPNPLTVKCGDKPLVLLGPLRTSEKQLVGEWLSQIHCPVVAEGLSQFQGDPILQGRQLHSGDQFLLRAFMDGVFDSLVRVGGVPCTRLWRDLEYMDVPVINFSDLPFSGMGRLPEPPHKLGDLGPIQHKWTQSEIDNLMANDFKVREIIHGLLKEFPWSEPACVSWLSRQWPDEKGQLFLGNSLPIRAWDQFAVVKGGQLEVLGQRGANGIDGMVSHFLGAIDPARPNMAILGDLTALYDLTGLWAKKYIPKEARSKLVVINNFGGQIFSQLSNNSLFLNSHKIRLGHWAQLFDISIQSLTQPQDLNWQAGLELVEILPDAEQSKGFWQAYKEVLG